MCLIQRPFGFDTGWHERLKMNYAKYSHLLLTTPSGMRELIGSIVLAALAVALAGCGDEEASGEANAAAPSATASPSAAPSARVAVACKMRAEVAERVMNLSRGTERSRGV